ncbi:hypothetical protein PINS_up008502 [Pythium insidiosum]|nr:hypothetical protein PINS_up008502 [Pythium insidiosum]
MSSRLENNSFLCPLPQVTPNASFFGALTCRCVNGRSLLNNESFHDGIIPAARANKICGVCPRGAYSNSSTEHKCTLCPLGFISRDLDDRPGADGCDPCKPGTFANETGLSECRACPRGSFASNSGQAICDLCPPGEISASLGSDVCLPCGVGSYAPVDGSVKCLPCPRGTFAPGTGELECLQCPTGYFQDNEGQGSCRACPPGYVAPSPGHWECQPCGEGTYHVPETKSCVLCSPNSFARGPGQTRCSPCPLGQIAQGYGNTKCYPRVTPGLGWISIANATLISCAPGTFNNGSFLTCQPCDFGQFNARTGASSCAHCPRGFFSNETGAVACRPAPAGTFVGDEGAWHPTFCPSGTFSNSTDGMQSCQHCPPKTYRLETGGSACATAKPGEILENVTWHRVQWSLLGVRFDDLLNETLQTELMAMWKIALAAHGARDLIPHLIETQRIAPNAEAVDVILAMEKVPPEPVKRRPKSSEDIFMKIKNTLTLLQSKLNDAKETVTRWVDKATHNDRNKGVDYSRVKPTNVTQVLSNASGFDTSLLLQLERTHALSVSKGTMRIRLLPEPLQVVRAKPCPKGTFAVNSTTALGRRCQPCPIGHYSDTEGALRCRRCLHGTFGDQEGLSACWSCPWNKGSGLGATECHDCSFLAWDCKSFADNVVTAIALGVALAVTLWRRTRAATRDAEWAQRRAESLTLVASIRIHGRVLSAAPAPALGPVGGPITVEELVGVQRAREERQQ